MLTGYFNDVLENYHTSISVGKFNKNHEMFQLINYTITKSIDNLVKEYGLSARGSSGAGTWTKYPWIAVYNEEITNTIQKGVYIVYLFSEDMNRLYLTLNQGCTSLKNDLGTKNAREAMISTRQKIRGRLNNNKFATDNDLNIGNIDYEIGSIFYKEYYKNSFPPEEEFIEDLKDMLDIYNDYFNRIFLDNPEGEENIKIKTGEKPMKENIRKIHKTIKSQGYIFTYEDLSNFYLSLKTKPFLILAGISGTGKSKLIKLFANAINGGTQNSRYNIISVKPDWNDSTELLGYKNINDKFIPGQLIRIIEEASRPENTDKPYFVCLDEMNLARVEYYLSEYLSIIESRYLDKENRLTSDRIFPNGYLPAENKYDDIRIPGNLYIIGTVNMDDTTFSFSRKVLDRVNTIEFSEVRLDLLDFEIDNAEEGLILDNSWFETEFLSIKDATKSDKEYVTKINREVIVLNNILAMGNKHFGYRVRDEIVFYMLENRLNGLLDENVAFDYQIMQKVLPTITGSDTSVRDILISLYNYCNPGYEIVEGIDYIKDGESGLESALYLKSAKKILNMLKGYEDGFVSFW